MIVTHLAELAMPSLISWRHDVGPSAWRSRKSANGIKTAEKNGTHDAIVDRSVRRSDACFHDNAE